MAFTRKFLSAMGLEAEKIDEIMTAHVEVIDHYKNRIDESKNLSDELDTLKTANAELTKQLKDTTDKITAYEKDDYKGKYESEKAEHDKLKADVAGKETLAKKEAILKDWLKETKYSDEGSMVILDSKEDYVNRIQLDENGKATNLKEVTDAIQKKHYMYTPKETVKGSTPDNPPINNGGNAFERMSLGEKMKYANENPNDAAVLNWIGRK